MGFEETVLDINHWLDRNGIDRAYKKDMKPTYEAVKPDLELQAEISYKAGMKQGIWLFAWWKDGEQYVGTSGRTLKEAYKELGIE